MKGIIWAALKGVPAIERRYSNGKPHHITLHYGVERERFSWLENQEFDAIIWAEAWNDRIQALRVHVPFGYPRSITHPHITVSWVDGTAPVESNTMLEAKHEYRLLSPNLFIPCRIEFYKWHNDEGGDRHA